MKSLILILVLGAGLAWAGPGASRKAGIDAAVIHAGHLHVLSCGTTRLVLDGSKGLSIKAIGEAVSPAPDLSGILGPAFLRVELVENGRVLWLDQANDPAPKLQIITQGATHVAARAFFTLRTGEGRPMGTGTLDIFISGGRVHLAPSVFVDDMGPGTRIRRAGLFLSAPGGAALEINGRSAALGRTARFVPFGKAEDHFHLALGRPAGPSAVIGWARNTYPAFPYLREIDKNPEKDDLYEHWPSWIALRGMPPNWSLSVRSGVEAAAADAGAELALLWNRDLPLEIPAGGYQAFNGVLTICPGATPEDARRTWDHFRRPLVPAATKGEFRFYNEFQGSYEVDSKGGAVELAFDGRNDRSSRAVTVRFWNLKGKNACAARLNGAPLPISLINDGGLIEDPMVSIDKRASGPAAEAVVLAVLPPGRVSRLTFEREPGIQFTYQMASEQETYEAWSDRCGERPLVLFHLREASLYHARLPARRDYAFFKWPLYWVKNGVNPATFLNNTVGFAVSENGPAAVRFMVAATNPLQTALSVYSCRIAEEAGTLRFDVTAEFSPLDDGRRWTSLEYCDLYPFDGVRRGDFHYRDIVYLDRAGIFSRIGTGAWNHKFELVAEPDRSGYHSDYVPRQGPGARVPDPADGSVWILGDNPERGNILYRRGEWSASVGVSPVFTLCNAWVDIHNALDRKGQALGSGEKISCSVEIFAGPVPPIEALNSMVSRAAMGRKAGWTIEKVRYSESGTILGFILK